MGYFIVRETKVQLVNFATGEKREVVKLAEAEFKNSLSYRQKELEVDTLEVNFG